MGKREYVPIYWFDAPHPRKPLPVIWMDDEQYPALAKEHPTGGETVAYFDEEGWRIILWAGLRVGGGEVRQVIVHELGHACWSEDEDTHMSGLAQEKALQNTQVGLAETLHRSGWRLPPLPPGLRSLATHARHLRYGRAQRSPGEDTE
jgi:hypothetical protein